MKRKTRVLVLAAVLLAGAAAAVSAQETGVAQQGSGGLAGALIALAAALAVGLAAVATAFAQGRIGAAGAGTIAEKPETAGSILLMLALPETMVILGFVVAIVILFVR
jgi:V/A-type H+/Na+-transporting ATPase subunit K